MRFVYKLQKKMIPRLNSLSSTMGKIMAAANSTAKTMPIINDEDDFDEIVVGGYFLPDDYKTSVLLTPEYIIKNHRDQINQSNLYLQSYFPPDPIEVAYANQHPSERKNNISDTNYIGKWTNDIDTKATVYYVIVDGKIRKLIFSKPIETGTYTDIFGVIYILEDEGNMVYCTPDEGDIMFDNIKEAKKYIKENYDIFTPLH